VGVRRHVPGRDGGVGVGPGVHRAAGPHGRRGQDGHAALFAVLRDRGALPPPPAAPPDRGAPGGGGGPEGRTPVSGNYVTYYALGDGQRCVAGACFRLGLAALLLCGGGLALASAAFAKPAGVEPSFWPWTPADWYSLGCTAMFALVFVGGAAFAFAVRQYWV